MREAPLKPGDVLQVNMNAGDGYGDRLARDPAAVLGDVLDGYMSIQGAREDYGEIISVDNAAVDVDATNELRDERRLRGEREST